VNAVARLVVWR